MRYQLPKLPTKVRSSVAAIGALVRQYYLRLALLAFTCFGVAFYLWLAELDDIIEERMVSLEWPLPSRIYARPLELYPGLTVKSDELVSELRLLGYRESSVERAGNFSNDNNQLVIHSRGFEFSDGVQPPEVATLTFEGDNEDRILLSFDDLPPKFVDTLIAVEDKRFMQHHGISIRGIFRAAWVNMREGTKAQGASTLTQQLVKGLFLTRDKTWSRKITEIFMALVLDWRYTKEEILTKMAIERFMVLV